MHASTEYCNNRNVDTNHIYITIVERSLHISALLGFFPLTCAIAMSRIVFAPILYKLFKSK